MKRLLAILLLTAVLLFSISCSKQETVTQETSKPVKGLEVKEEKRQKVLDYTGMVQSDELKKISFKSPGRIEKVYVEKGEKIVKNQVLARLDTEELEFALDVSSAQMEAALDAYDFANDNFQKVESLYREGAISEHDFNKVQLELDIRSSEVSQVKTDYNQKKSLLDDAMLKSDIDGYVVDVLFEEGEMISVGYPAIIIRSESQVVNVGLSGKDTGKIQLGNKAIIKVDDIETTGEIASIAQMPDEQTLTYNVEISLAQNQFILGTIVRVEIITGEEKGIWIPITSIMADGDDYVFIIKEGMAEKRKIIIDDIRGSQVKIRGINSGEQLAIEGMRRLKDVDRVIIQD